MTAKDIKINGINNLEQVIGYTRDMQNNLMSFLYDESIGTISLGTLGGNSQALSINDKSQIVGKSKNTEGKNHAFIWDKENGILK